MTLQRYIGVVSGLTLGTDKEGASFQLHLDDGTDIFVIPIGGMPAIVTDCARIEVAGDWSHTSADTEMKMFGAHEVSRVDSVEEDDPTGEKLRALYSHEDWQKELRKLGAGKLDEFYNTAFEKEKLYVGTINFHVAVMDRFFDLGFLSGVLTDDERKACRDRAEAITDLVRHVFRDDQEKIRRFEEAYASAKKAYYERFDSDAVRKSGIPNVD